MSKVCVMCASRRVQERFENSEISAEESSDIMSKIRWKILAEPNKIRLVCGEECYDKMLELLEELRKDRKQEKCTRKGCNHKEKLHKGMGKSCSAVQCACYRFLGKDSIMEEDREENYQRSNNEQSKDENKRISSKLTEISERVKANGGSVEDQIAACKKFVEEDKQRKLEQRNMGIV